MTAPFFEAQGLGVAFGGRVVLDSIGFTLAQGTLTALLGANGVGKTTLLRAVCGLVPHSGRCRLTGEALEGLGVRALARRVSYIPQRGGLAASLPALDVVLMGFYARLGVLAYPTRAHRAAARAALETVGAWALAEQDFTTLSEGQKQLVLLARTLAEDTGLLLLDEPDSALDLRNRYLVLCTLRRLVKSGPRAGLLCLHDPALALECCDCLLLLKNAAQVVALWPERDAPEVIEAHLRDCYGPLTLVPVED